MKPTKMNCQKGSVAVIKENQAVEAYLEPGGFFGSKFLLRNKSKVEIIHAPRVIKGINVIFVKCLKTNQEGYIYWCEFSKSFEMESLVPGTDLPKTKAEKLLNKIHKMANPGYYVKYLVDESGKKIYPSDNLERCSVICIAPDATAKYIRYQNDNEYYTLNWNCAPTRKFMTTKNHLPNAPKNKVFESRYEYYKTWQDFSANCKIPVPPYSLLNKAPNDTFSP